MAEGTGHQLDPDENARGAVNAETCGPVSEDPEETWTEPEETATESSVLTPWTRTEEAETEA